MESHENSKELPAEASPPKVAEDVGAYIQTPKDTEFRVRWKAAVALCKIDDPCAIPALLVALQDKESSIRWRVTSALSKLAKVGGVLALIEALKDRKISLAAMPQKRLAILAMRMRFQL